MTLRYSSSDSYANNRDNLSQTVPQFADSRQNPKYILSADNLSLRSTVSPALTAFIKTTHNKVAGQLLSRLLIAQAQTATQNIGRQILHNFSSRFLSSPEICTSRIKACVKSKNGRSKTRAKKFIALFYSIKK